MTPPTRNGKFVREELLKRMENQAKATAREKVNLSPKYQNIDCTDAVQRKRKDARICEVAQKTFTSILREAFLAGECHYGSTLTADLEACCTENLKKYHELIADVESNYGLQHTKYRAPRKEGEEKKGTQQQDRRLAKKEHDLQTMEKRAKDLAREKVNETRKYQDLDCSNPIMRKRKDARISELKQKFFTDFLKEAFKEGKCEPETACADNAGTVNKSPQDCDMVYEQTNQWEEKLRKEREEKEAYRQANEESLEKIRQLEMDKEELSMGRLAVSKVTENFVARASSTFSETNSVNVSRVTDAITSPDKMDVTYHVLGESSKEVDEIAAENFNSSVSPKRNLPSSPHLMHTPSSKRVTMRFEVQFTPSGTGSELLTNPPPLCLPANAKDSTTPRGD